MKGFEDKGLADLGAVGVCGIDKVDTQFDRTTEDPDALIMVGGLTPDTRTSNAHGAEPKTVDRQVA